MEINILYEDNHLLVAVKPPEVPVQADSSGADDFLGMLKAYIKEKYISPGMFILVSYTGWTETPGVSWFLQKPPRQRPVCRIRSDGA